MRILAALFLLATVPAVAQTSPHPRDTQIQDADTRAWWHTTEALAGDDMEGRDTGSVAYQRAADYVARRFEQAGLQPAGEGGGYFQKIAMQQVDVQPAGTSIAVLRKDGSRLPLSFLDQITVAASLNLAPVSAPITFRGYCGKDAMQNIAGQAVLCYGTQRTGLPGGGERTANARAGHAAALINLDDPGFTIEPPRWPYAYARTVTVGRGETKAAATAMPVMRLNYAAFADVLTGAGQDALKLIEAGNNKQPLPSFDIPAKLEAKWAVTEKQIESPNVLAVLPGSDATLKNEYLVVAAHLDGYGYGTPVAGDNLYNGALDDAAYVALLIQFADNLKREHKTLKRSLLVCAFTGEEKGLLGSRYFVAHPTIPLAQLAADINLDQIRPLFPLRILTVPGVDETSLGAVAAQVAQAMNIEIRPDREPERGLLRRADNFPFLTAGVPAIGFIFGYDPGTVAEKRYREWYQVRYHRPQDDVTQPMNFEAAAKFNRFFYALTETVANGAARPTIYPQSTFAKPSASR